jgi:hypothetical protein
MVLGGIDTAADRTYDDALAVDPDLAAGASKVTVEGDASLSDTATDIEIVTMDGQRVRASHDLAARLSTDAVERGLRTKAEALLGAEAAGRLWDLAARTERHSAREVGAALRGS